MAAARKVIPTMRTTLSQKVRKHDASGPVRETGNKRVSADTSDKELLLSLLFRTCIKLQTILDRRFAPLCVTAQEARLLLHCANAGETSAVKLAAWMGRDEAKISQFVRRLEASKLLSRTRASRDPRVLLIRVTARGQNLAPQLRMIFKEARAKLFAGISDEDSSVLQAVVTQMCLNAEHLRSEAVNDLTKFLAKD
jgi:DNA-binding MarR family transcriptional regulator